MARTIPLPYRIIFVFLDVALPFMGIAMNTFAPEMALQNFTPKPSSSISPETYVLLDCTSGFFAALAFLNIYLLVYRPNDVPVWRGLVGAMILQDLFMIGGFLRELRLREAKFPAGWSGQDLGNVIGYSAIAMVRALFVLGIGMGQTISSGSKKEL